jgi:hypothetical protein
VPDAFNSSPANIGSLLSSNQRERIVIPTFQRGYMWKKKHVEAFWEDVDKQRTVSAAKKGADPHFFGPIVTLSRPAEEIVEILDGQQRLATATILFSVIRDIGEEIYKATGVVAAHDLARQIDFQFIRKENGDYAIELGETDRQYFKDTIQLDPPVNTRPKIFTHRNIKAARETLREKVTATLGGAINAQMDSVQSIAILKALKQTLVSDLVMARIPVTSQESAFKIFTTLNDRGLRLSPPDLLLSYLMEKAPNDADRKIIRGLWTEMVQRMGTHDIERFMRHMWVSRYGDLKKEDLFTALKNHLDKQQISSVEFARLCGDECDNYIQLLMVEEEHLPKGSIHLVRALTRELNFQPAFPLLLSSYLLLQDGDFIKVAGYLLVFVTRYSIISNLDPGGMEDLLFKLARDVRAMVKDSEDEAGSKSAVKHVKDTLSANAPNDDKVKANAADEKLTLENAEAKYVLSRLANYMQDPEKQVGLAETNLEHIYPQNPEAAEWGGAANQEKLEPFIWNIGNLTIYGKKANRKVANSEYPAKQAKYKDSKILMTQKIAAEYNNWDEITIKDRAAKLAKLVVQVWNFDNTSRV